MAVKKLEKINGKTAWTPQALKHIIDYCYEKTQSELGNDLGVEKTVVRRKMAELKLFETHRSPFNNGINKSFSKEEDDFIRSNFRVMCNAELGLNLNRTKGGIAARIIRLKLVRTETDIDRIRNSPGAIPDSFVAHQLSQGSASKEEFLKYPSLIELKRKHIILTQMLKSR